MKRLISGLLTLTLLCATVVSLTACSGGAAKQINSKSDLEGATIGVQLGTTGDTAASEYEKKGATVQRFNKGADAVLALTQGKIDCVIIDNEPAKAFVAANKGTKILDEPFADEDYAICVAKDNDKLKNDINTALRELKSEGVVDQIINNYIGDDTKGTCPYETPKGTDHSKGTLHMATNAAFEPYEFEEGGKIIGIDAMLAQAICDKLGYELVIDDMDFDAIITAVQSGKADFGMAGMTADPEREESINFTDAYTKSKQVIIVKE